MTAEHTRAAQYIRMSTDRQDLSPLIQKDAIAAFAAAKGFEVVRSYEDEGKSGVKVSNRPRLRQLLRDVADDGAPFTAILVYDVSRWGRFQDADAAAYYEYHCRMHGVQVIYISETFANDLTPASVLLKSMRRVMAAEYSRDIAQKSRAGQQRVITMGFHMGPLPPLGYRRCSVSADGKRRKLLEHGERKLALTDRIEWVLGPEQEVALVRRICSAYVAGLEPNEIAGLANAERWRTEKGRPVSTGTVKILLKHEALIGNFVWGVKSKGGQVITCTPSRMDGSVPRIIEDKTWTSIQARLGKAGLQDARRGQAPDRIKRGARRPQQLRLALGPSGAVESYRRTLGTPEQLRDHTRDFGRALCAALSKAGLSAGFDTRTNVLTFWDTRVRIRLMWPSGADTWQLERSRSLQVQHVLVARMTALCCPADFFVIPLGCMQTALSRKLRREVPAQLKPYWCNSAEQLIGALSKIAGSKAGRRTG